MTALVVPTIALSVGACLGLLVAGMCAAGKRKDECRRCGDRLIAKRFLDCWTKAGDEHGE
jgi:hypothetical protein